MKKRTMLHRAISCGVAAIALFSTTNLYADDPCSQKAFDSVLGQVSRQLQANLHLGHQQQAELNSAANIYFSQIDEALKLNRANKTNLLSVIKKAAEDKVIDEVEMVAIENATAVFHDSRLDTFEAVMSGRKAVESVLTDRQEQLLKEFKPVDIVIPADVQLAIEQVKMSILTAKDEYSATASISEQTKQHLYNSLILLIDAVYLPDDMRENIKMQLEIIIELAGTHLENGEHISMEKIYGREGIERLAEFIGNFMKSIETGAPLSFDDMVGSFSKAGMVKKTFLEVFMLTPVFQCNYNK